MLLNFEEVGVNSTEERLHFQFPNSKTTSIN